MLIDYEFLRNPTLYSGVIWADEDIVAGTDKLSLNDWGDSITIDVSEIQLQISKNQVAELINLLSQYCKSVKRKLLGSLVIKSINDESSSVNWEAYCPICHLICGGYGWGLKDIVCECGVEYEVVVIK